MHVSRAFIPRPYASFHDDFLSFLDRKKITLTKKITIWDKTSSLYPLCALNTLPHAFPSPGRFPFVLLFYQRKYKNHPISPISYTTPHPPITPHITHLSLYFTSLPLPFPSSTHLLSHTILSIHAVCSFPYLFRTRFYCLTNPMIVGVYI